VTEVAPTQKKGIFLLKKATEEKKEPIKGTKYLLLKNQDKLKTDDKDQLHKLLGIIHNPHIADINFSKRSKAL